MQAAKRMGVSAVTSAKPRAGRNTFRARTPVQKGELKYVYGAPCFDMRRLWVAGREADGGVGSGVCQAARPLCDRRPLLLLLYSRYRS